MVLSRVFLNNLAIPLSLLWPNSKEKMKLDKIEQKLLMSRIQSASSTIGTKKKADDPSPNPNDKNKLAKMTEQVGSDAMDLISRCPLSFSINITSSVN